MRIIDADALKDKIIAESDGTWMTVWHYIHDIDSAPTIDGLKDVLEKTTRAIVQLQDVINDNVCISGRFRLDTLMKELKGIRAIIEKYDQHGSRAEKEAPDEH